MSGSKFRKTVNLRAVSGGYFTMRNSLIYTALNQGSYSGPDIELRWGDEEVLTECGSKSLSISPLELKRRWGK
jgi:hypothetical protein